MNKPDLSIIVPAIRQVRWQSMYESILLACKNHSFELILISPFNLPESLSKYDNIKLVHERGCVSRAVQRGVLEASADLIFLTVDDATFTEDSIDAAINEYREKCVNKLDVLNVRYSEGGTIQSPEYYNAYFHESTRLAGISPEWNLAPQFLMRTETYIDLGGFDCQFEYINEPVHDLMFRIQKLGGKVYQSTKHACVATWYECTTGDHAPIHYAQTSHDWPIFRAMYQQPNNRTYIDYDNWKNCPPIWLRRFTNGVPNSYEELVQQEGYKV